LASFAFIEFETKEMAEAAVSEMNGVAFRGRTVVVDFRNVRSRMDSARAPLPPSKTIFIGNLAYEMTDADLNDLFDEYPDAREVRIAVDRRTGQPRGFAHADFRTVEGAIRAKDSLMGRVFHGRRLRVDFAGKRENNLPRDADAGSNESADGEGSTGIERS
jgi:nucleolin